MSTSCTRAPWRRQPPGGWRALAGAVGVTAGVAVAGFCTPARAQPAASAWTLVDLPGGVAGFRQVLGPSLDASRVFIEAARRIDSPDENEAGVRRELRAYMETVDGPDRDTALAVDRVPLPLSEDVWRRVAFEGRAREGLARAVISDRRASLLAYGLSSLDPAMLAWFAARPDLLRGIYRDHAGSFAVFGRSLRVEQGRVVPAGGEHGRGQWERLTGVSTTSPERFFLALLDRHEGRLAWLYDTVAHLDAPHVDHLFGTPAGDTARDRVDTLARVFVAVDKGIWKVEDRPFRRPSPDPALFLSAAALDETGRVVSPLSRAGWEAVLARRATRGGSRPISAGDSADLVGVDLAWLTERVFAAAPRPASDQYRMVLFAQRVFGLAPANASDEVVTALEGFLEFPVLGLTLERMGLSDPALHARASMVAARLTRVGDDAGRHRLMMQFQGALALVWRLQAVGTIDADTTRKLVSGLLGLPVDPRNRYAGGVARWMRTDVLAAIGASLDTSDVEEALVAALSGAPGAARPRGDARPSPLVDVEWEGSAYVVDLARADARALRATREAQLGYSIDQALVLASAGDALTSVQGLDQVSSQRAALAAMGDRLPPVRKGAGVPSGLTMEPARIVAAAVADLDRVRSAADLGRARNVAASLVDLGDAVLADVLAAWAYAVAALGSDDPGLQTIGLVRRHDLSPRNELDPERHRGPWRLPRPVPVLDVPWHIGGSLLALDFALAESRLRRIEADTLPSPLTADDNIRFVLAQHVILLDPRRLADEHRDAIVSAVSRGRRRALAAAGGREDFETLARVAGVSEWRRESIRWRATTDPGALPDGFSLGELLYLGLDDMDRSGAIAPWGPSEEPRTGALRARWPAPAHWESLAGHRGTGMVATGFTDLVIRVAQALARAQLPAALAPAVLAGATWDLCANVRLASSDDWLALVARAQAIPDARFDDYVATLTGEGPLAPASDNGGRVP